MVTCSMYVLCDFIERQKILTRWEDAVKRCNATVDKL